MRVNSDDLLYLEVHPLFTMHVCVIVRMCAYMFACANLGARVRVCVYVYVGGVDLFYMQIQPVFTMHVCVRVCMCAYLCVCEYMHVYVYVCVCLCVCARACVNGVDLCYL